MDSQNVFEVLMQEPHNIQVRLYANEVPLGTTDLEAFQEVLWDGYLPAASDRWDNLQFGSEFVSRRAGFRFVQETNAVQAAAHGWYATVHIGGEARLVAYQPFVDPIRLGAPRVIELRVRMSAWAPDGEGNVAMEVDSFGVAYQGKTARQVAFRGDERRLLQYLLGALRRIAERDASLSSRVPDSRLSLVPVFPSDAPQLVAAVERVSTRLRHLLSL